MLDAVETGEEKWENVVRQVDEIIKKKLTGKWRYRDDFGSSGI